MNVTKITIRTYLHKFNVHYCFHVPGRILMQVVEMPDHSRYMTVKRTVDCRLRPRHNCQQRTHDSFHSTLMINEGRRGVAHFES